MKTVNLKFFFVSYCELSKIIFYLKFIYHIVLSLKQHPQDLCELFKLCMVAWQRLAKGSCSSLLGVHPIWLGSPR